MYRSSVSKLSQIIGSLSNLQVLLNGTKNGLSPYRILWKSFFVGPPNDEKPPDQPVQPNVKPKYPPGVFTIYLMAVREQIIRNNPGINPRDILKKASEQWRNIRPDEKAPFVAHRRKLYLKYREDEKGYLENRTPEEILETEAEKEKKKANKLKKAKISLEIPKRPSTSFAEFVKSKHINGHSSQEDFKKSVQEWNSLDKKTKEIYEEIARKNKEDYDKKMDIWENEMIALGRFDVLRKKTLNKLKER